MKEPKFKSGERSLAKKQNVTHNNIITANNVIINYSGDKTGQTKQPTIESKRPVRMQTMNESFIAHDLAVGTSEGGIMG